VQSGDIFEALAYAVVSGIAAGTVLAAVDLKMPAAHQGETPQYLVSVRRSLSRTPFQHYSPVYCSFRLPMYRLVNSLTDSNCRVLVMAGLRRRLGKSWSLHVEVMPQVKCPMEMLPLGYQRRE
jgi:hypothetical protein